MRRQSAFKGKCRPDVLVCPQVAHPVAWRRETEIFPRVMCGLSGIADVKYCDVRVSTGLGPRGPYHDVVSSDDGMIIRGVLIDRDDLGVSKQRSGPGIGQQ